LTRNQRAHLSLLATTLIFGLHYTIAKSLMPESFSPMQVIFIRTLGGVILFWLFQRLFIAEKVDRKDLFMLAICGILGFALNQTLFYVGLNMTTPVDASIIHVLIPILVLVFAGIILKEKITFQKAVGIALGAGGAVLLILYGHVVSFSGKTMFGNILVFANAVFYALYLIMIKPLVGKYHTATILKWVSFFGFLAILPFSIRPAMNIDFSSVKLMAWLGIAYIIVLNTFFAYLLINFALQRVTPLVVSYYSYIQPVVASLSFMVLGQGVLSFPKIIAALIIFSGVYLVNRPERKATLK